MANCGYRYFSPLDVLHTVSTTTRAISFFRFQNMHSNSMMRVRPKTFDIDLISNNNTTSLSSLLEPGRYVGKSRSYKSERYVVSRMIF